VTLIKHLLITIPLSIKDI